MNIASLLRKKWLLAIVAAGVVGSVGYAFAATLNVSSSSLGAGDASVSACAQAVNASYTTAYNDSAATSHSAVKTVTITFPASPNNHCKSGDTLEVVLEGGTSPVGFVYTLPSDAPGTVTVTAGVTPQAHTADPSEDGVESFLDPATIVDASDVSGVAVSAAGAATVPTTT